jgi:class 3 adenylate cyclase
MSAEDQKVKANENIGSDLAGSNLASIGVDMYDTKPIADLFPNTTIMFADIAGFTAWSSVREPSQVFTLLETVYQAFDTIAKRRRVFKVETVGDCYVAVTGLPEPRKDHAFTMAKFARECLVRFNELSKQLEVMLGPDTGDLAMRAGLHSGPVTAGVLRGDKSRFQLFGDTVNTAARIESSGMRNKVHLSSETAELLIEAGKANWVQRRADLVSAKGKGKIQTYWLHNPHDVIEEDIDKKDGTSSLTIANRSTLDGVALETLEKSLPPKILRLVRWNVEILKKLLQSVIAKRQGQATPKKWGSNIEKRERELTRNKQCLEEVAEIIALPKYDLKAYVDASKVEIPTEVVNALRHFVCMIASMHQENHFHNFEHASHVTMSVSKLLSRIVAPDEVINGKYGNDLGMSLHDHTYGITSDPLTQFSIVLAALIHDVDHSGVSNFQLIKEHAKIASFFKRKSVAEQNSIVLAWDQLMLPKYNILRRCIYTDQSELDRFRQILINNVLATDIFDKELQGQRKKRWENAFQKYSTPSNARQSTPLDDVNRKATIVMEHLIQASDVSHTMQHWHIYQKWNERLFAEMTVAYQNGRVDKDPTENWYQGELGFFDNYIIPLAKKLKECGVFGVSCDEYLNYALENRREWATKGEEAVANMFEKYAKKPKPGRRNSLTNASA